MVHKVLTNEHRYQTHITPVDNLIDESPQNNPVLFARLHTSLPCR
jgi:hypothetical protein